MGDLTLMLRANGYGAYSNSNTISGARYFQDYGSLVQYDLEAKYAFNENLSVTVGGRNITDKYPAKDTTGDATNGRIYESGGIIDWQGGFYYLRLNASF